MPFQFCFPRGRFSPSAATAGPNLSPLFVSHSHLFTSSSHRGGAARLPPPTDCCCHVKMMRYGFDDFGEVCLTECFSPGAAFESHLICQDNSTLTFTPHPKKVDIYVREELGRETPRLKMLESQNLQRGIQSAGGELPLEIM